MAYAALCDQLAIPYLETYRPLRQNQIWMNEVASGDESHPGSAGYKAFSQLVLDWAAWQEWFE